MSAASEIAPAPAPNVAPEWRDRSGVDTDVVVVGFGPTGALAATLLANAGLRVTVVERYRAVYDKPRAVAIDHEILRCFQNAGVSEAVLPYIAPFSASQHFGVDGQLIRRIDMVPAPYPLGYVPSMVFSQPPVEAALRAHALSRDGVDIVWAAFRSLEQDARVVRLVTVDDDGAERTIRARAVIGCDGASSPIRQHLGIALEDLVFDEPWLVVDIRLRESATGNLPETSAQFCDPARPTTFIIGPGDHRRFEIMLDEGEDPVAMQHPDAVWRLLSPWIGPDEATLWRAASYRFHALVAADWRRGRVFIAGDAAHQQPPFIGQGMCQGMRDVANVAWKLAAVLAGESGDALLDTYADERAAHVRTLTDRIKTIGRAICERDPARARARDAALIESGGGRAPVVTRQDIVPPLQTGLLSAARGAGTGTLCPQPWIARDGGRVRLDTVAGSGWRVLRDGRHGTPQLPAAPAGAPPLATVVLAPAGDAPADEAPGTGADAAIRIAETEGVLGAWFDRLGITAAVVRPDHYVFGTAATDAALDALLAELAARLRAPTADEPTLSPDQGHVA